MLPAGEAVERPLAGGEVHSYRLRVEAGQYIKVEVFQYWISVELRLFDPAGKPLQTVKLHGDEAQTETLSALPEQTGDFKIEVKTTASAGTRGRYTITLARQRGASTQDKQLIAADQMFVDAFALARQGNRDEAVSLGAKAVANYEDVFGANHLELVEPLRLLAVLQRNKSNYTAAADLHNRALTIREQALGHENLAVAESLLDIGQAYLGNSKFAQAKAVFAESLRIREKLLPADDLRIAQAANDLGNSHRNLEEFAQAEPLLLRSLRMQERILGGEHATTLRALNNLASFYATRGDYGRAEPLFARVAEISEKLFPDSPLTGIALFNWARVNTDFGDIARAEPLAARALALFERVWGREHGDVARVLALQGRIYNEQLKLEEAEQAYTRAIAIREKIFGKEHSLTMAAQGGLGNVLMSRQKFQEAAKLYSQLVQTEEKVFGLNRSDLAGDLVMLGLAYHSIRKPLEAEAAYQRAIAIYERTLGSDHPYLYEAHTRLMQLYKTLRRVPEVLREQARVLELSETSLAHNLLAGDERQKLSYISRFNRDISDILSTHTRLASDNPQALEQAMTVLLLRKGRALDEMGQTISLLRNRAAGADIELFDQLTERLGRLSALTTSPLGAIKREVYLQQVEQLNTEIARLQATLGERSREFRAQTQPITVEAIRQKLPANGALIEFARFKSYEEEDNRKFEEKYAAYILLPNGTLRWALLGKAEEIDRAIEAWRSALDLRTPAAAADLNKRSRRLDALVMQPIRAQVGNVRQLFIAPDGDLNLISFAALRDERGRYLIEKYLPVYLTSGRDLLRLQIKHESRPEKLIFAVSDFDARGGASNATPLASSVSDTRGGRLSAGATMATLRFDPLKHVREEAEAVQRAVPQATLYADAQATETALKQVHRPYFLHIVTHGFFLPDGEQKQENPLLRSGLALAGANQRHSGGDDGLLTAFEAAALDLWGTKLVVLSACDTGNGQIKNGEGVFGLRRALVLAGAETQVASLWRADDLVTRKLMQQFYTNLNAGLGRAEALQQAQLKLLRGGATPSPYYWANFICIGEWKPLGQ